jgi:hypothetical protein
MATVDRYMAWQEENDGGVERRKGGDQGFQVEWLMGSRGLRRFDWTLESSSGLEGLKSYLVHIRMDLDEVVAISSAALTNL